MCRYTKKGTLWCSGLWFFKCARVVLYLGNRHARFAQNFLKVSTTRLRIGKALVRLRLCAGSPDPLLVGYVISTRFSCAFPYTVNGYIMYIFRHFYKGVGRGARRDGATLMTSYLLCCTSALLKRISKRKESAPPPPPRLPPHSGGVLGIGVGATKGKKMFPRGPNIFTE